MTRIHVCSLSRLHETIEASEASHVLTVMSLEEPPPVPARIAPGRHRLIGVSDIVAPTDGARLPQAAHIAQALTFVRGWDRAAPLVIHCYAGVSRSTASAFIAACALRPDLPEAVFARAIRERSPTATPNPRFVALADALLRREGRMIAAIADIGRGVDCYEGEPFHLDLGADAP